MKIIIIYQAQERHMNSTRESLDFINHVSMIKASLISLSDIKPFDTRNLDARARHAQLSY